jgi:hypothetical protein
MFLIASTAWVDVAIPGLIGLGIVLFPRLFSKPTGDLEKDFQAQQKVRGIGCVLLLVAAGYALMRVMSG